LPRAPFSNRQIACLDIAATVAKAPCRIKNGALKYSRGSLKRTSHAWSQRASWELKKTEAEVCKGQKDEAFRSYFLGSADVQGRG
jgi:hypothetical protein